MVRAGMHCMNTLPLCYSSRNLNMGANGSMWPPYNSDQIWKSAPGFDAFPPCSMKQDLGYEKEVLKQIMLKQEAIFVDQVSELHRLYRRQKGLMDDIERGQLLKCQMQPQQCSSQFEPELAEKSVLSTTNLQPPSSLKWSQQMSDERKKPKKQTFDLDLPADAYVDSEEGEQFEDKKVSEVREVPCLPPKNVSETPIDYGLFDLNGPAQVEEEEMLSNNLLSNVDLNVLCPTFSLSLAKNQELRECANSALESSQRSHNLHLQNYPRSVSSCIGTSQQLVLPSYMAKSEPFSAVSLRKPYGNLKHIPMAVQSRPCFKTPPSVHMSSRLSVGNQRISPDRYYLNGNFAGIPSVDGVSSLQNNLFFKSHLESTNLKAASLEANETNLLTRMESGVSQALMCSFDLKRVGYIASQNYDNVLGEKSCTPSHQISPLASKSHTNRFEEIEKNGDDKKPSGFGFLIDLNTCITENETAFESSVPSSVTKTGIDIDLEAPVSPENKEGSPPRGESEEHPLEPSAHLSKQEDRDKDPCEELVRVAAEAIVTLSSSEQLHGDSDSLLWFAGIISSLTSNLKNDLELEPYSCNGNSRKLNKENATPLPSLQRKERTTRRVKQKKDIQMGSLSCFAEWNLIKATGFPAETDSKRSASRNHRSKGRRRAKKRKLKANEEEPCLMESCCGGWGKVNRRKRGRRIAASKPYLIFQMGAILSSS